ncbi:hypothetical protein BZL30_0551 [Mycobacterium kansasii]|uniref:Uncharacterized protein n=1 Tax=Mycobacterium kansasii TaxID=1768 RepID=A0A1V3XTI6_MYCKA|nr:hypothetical protein BZL30_0551 [Mycobacterium kansasii]
MVVPRRVNNMTMAYPVAGLVVFRDRESGELAAVRLLPCPGGPA